METILLIGIIGLLIVVLFLIYVYRPKTSTDSINNILTLLATNEKAIQTIETSVKDELRQNRQELLDQLKANRNYF